MDYYYKEFDKLKEEFHEVMHDYPLFSETIRDIEEKDIKEINELINKNDEYYLKQANRKLSDLIDFINNTSTSIKEEYQKFDKLASIWEKVKITNVDDNELDAINSKVNEANRLINSHELKDLKEANNILERLIKDNK